MVTVRSHQYCIVVYLLLGPARFAINDFEELPASISDGLVAHSYEISELQRGNVGKHTVLVIPSVNRTNSIWLPGPSQCGFKVRTSLNAEACESAWL